MFNLHDFKSLTNESHIYKLINENDKETLSQLFNRPSEITSKLKSQLEDCHYDFGYINSQPNILINKLIKLSKDNAELTRSVIISGDIQAQIEIYHLMFKNTMETFAVCQAERQSESQHHSDEFVKERLIPESHNLFRNFQGRATGGLMGSVLAKSGVKMVFIFMQRLWRVGNEVDVDNCVEVMRSAIEEIQAIPVAGFFNLSDDCDPLPFWSGVTEQTYQFLRNTVLCTEMGDTVAPKPIREAALVLLLEMGLLYGSLSMQLQHVIMLIELSVGSKNYPNLSAGSTTGSANPVRSPMMTGCILSVLVRIARFVRQSLDSGNAGGGSGGGGWSDRSMLIGSNPCLRLLNWMKLENTKDGESDKAEICLLNAAVYMMSCLDSLTIDNQLSYADWYKSHLMNSGNIKQPTYHYENCLIDSFPSNENSSHKLFFIRLSNTSQNLIKGDIVEMKPDKLPQEENENFRIRKIVCSGVNTYILSEAGWLYEINSTSEDLVDTFSLKHNSINHQLEVLKTETPSRLSAANRVIDVDANIFSSHVLVVTEVGQVYSWGTNSSGKLGHGDMNDRRRPTLIDTFFRSHLPVKQVACGEEHNLILTQSGEIYACGRNHMGQLGLGDVKDRHVPTRIATGDLLGVIVKQTAVDGHQSMCLTVDGAILTWGSSFDNCRRHSINWVPKVNSCVHEYCDNIDQITVHNSNYTILLKSGSAYTWVKYCTECNRSDELQTEIDTVLKYQIDHIARIAKGNGELFFLEECGTIRTNILLKVVDQKFSGFGFIKRNSIVAWTVVKEPPRLTQPFILEVSIENLNLLSRLIGSIIANFGTTDADSVNNGAEKIESKNWFRYLLRINPNSKHELTEDRLCILVSSLHMLSVQLQKIVTEQLTIPTALLVQLKRDVINCCCGLVSQLHVSIKHAAHMCLISGWRILFSSQMEKLLGIYYTLQIADPSMSRYNLIVAMCFDTIDLKQFINTLIELGVSSSVAGSDLPTVDCVIETIIKYTFTNIRSALKLPTTMSGCKSTDKLSSMKNRQPLLPEQDLFMNVGAHGAGEHSSDHSISEKLLHFLQDLLKQTICLLRVTQDSLQPTLRLILMIYGKMLAQQATETIDYCWSLINKSTVTPKQLIRSLNRSGFDRLLLNFIESIRWLLKNYLKTKSIFKCDHKSAKNNTKPNTTNNPMCHYDLLFKFSLNMREIIFAFKPLILSLDKINRLNESVLIVDCEDGSLPGWLCNPCSMGEQIDDRVLFRMRDLQESNGQLIVIEDRVYDLETLSIDSKNRLDELLPNRGEAVMLTDIVNRNIHYKDIIRLLVGSYCGDYIDDDGQPISYFDNDKEDSSQLYFIERMLLMLMSDVLLFHQSCCSLMKRLTNFKQLHEFSIDKFPLVLKQIVLKKKSDQLQTNSDANNATILSFSHLEEKERDEVEETNDLCCNNPIIHSNDDNNRKIITTCINLLMYGSASSLIDKGTSIMTNILHWLRSDICKTKTMTATNSTLLLDNIQDPNLDTLFVLILISLTRHVSICDELANHIMRRNYEQPMSNELKIILQQSISIRKDIIKRHQQTSVSYKELCLNISIRCRFLIDEIEILSINNNGNLPNRKKSINLMDCTNEMSVTNRWKWLAIKAVASLKKPKKPTDYWQMIYNFICRKFLNIKSKPNKSALSQTENCEIVSDFCRQINQFLLNKEFIDLQKLRSLVFVKKIQYKCIINILREFKTLLQFSNGLLPGVQVSLLQFFCQKEIITHSTTDSQNQDEYLYDILQSVNSVATSNFVSVHMKQSLLQIEHSLVQLAIQLLRENLLTNEQKMAHRNCVNLLKNQSQIVGIGYWANGKLSLTICNFLLQSISWSNDIFLMMISSGTLGLIQTVMRQYHETEPGLVSVWCQQNRNYQLVTLDCSISMKDRCESADDLNSSAIATPSQLKKGMLVLRGRDWKYGDQDGPNSVGVVKREVVNGMVRVQWLNNNKTASYRAGKDNYYDLRLKKGIEDVNNENVMEFGMRSLMKDICLLQEKFLANRLNQQSNESSRKSFGKNEIEEKALYKLTSPFNWTQPSMLLLQGFGQLMQAIVIQQFVVSHSSKVLVAPCQMTMNKIYQLLWLIYKNGILMSIHKNDSIKNMYQEQMHLWCNESFLLTLLNQHNCYWPDSDHWIDLFLTKVEIQIKQFSNENVSNQILTFKIIERLIDRNVVSEAVIDRLWNCLEQSIHAHCSQDPKLIFNIQSINASPSKIRIMELAIIFRNMLRISSSNQLTIRPFLFDKIRQSLSQPDNNCTQSLALFCLFTDIENRIYHGAPICTTTKNSDQNETTYRGIVEEIGIVDNERYIITTMPSADAGSLESGVDRKSDYHSLTSDMKIDASKIQFPFEIFNSLSENESKIISKFLLMLLSNFANPTETDNNNTLSKIMPLQIQFNIMQLLTVMEFCEHNLTGLWYPVCQSDNGIFQLSLNIATRTCSIKPSISIHELGRTLNQLSANLYSTYLSETAVTTDTDKCSDVDNEDVTASKKRNKTSNWKSSTNRRELKAKQKQSNHKKKESLNINLDVQYRIIEMGFTKRQVQSAVRELARNGNLYLTSNLESIVTAILNLPNDDAYSVSSVEHVDDDEDDEDSTSLIFSDEDSSCSTVSDGLFVMPSRKCGLEINSATDDQSLNTSENEDNAEDNRTRNENVDTNDEAGNSSSSLDNSDDEEKPITPDTWSHTKNDFHASENVVCIKSFDSILIGDKGTLHLTDEGDQDHYNVFWTKINQSIESKKAYIHIFTSPFSSIMIGDEVQLSEAGTRHHSVSTMTALSTGIVRQIIGLDCNLKFVVDFPNCVGKICHLSHLKSVVKDYHNCQCQSCLKSPLPLPLYVCKICKNLYLCSDCYSKYQKSHAHKFITISVDKDNTINPITLSDNSFSSSRKLQYPTISTSTSKFQLKQSLSFTNWIVTHQTSSKNIEATVSHNNCLIKVAEGFQVQRIFMLISLSEFLILPSHVIVKSGPKPQKLSILYRAHVQSLQDHEIILNSSKYYSPESKLMWLKVYQEKSGLRSNNRVFSLDLFDESSSIRTVFNAVKSFHLYLSKTPEGNLQSGRHDKLMTDLAKSISCENLLKTIFSISDKNWSTNDIDTISNRTIGNWRQARMKKLQFHVELNSKETQEKSLELESPVNNDHNNANTELSCQGDNKLKSGLTSKVYVWGLNDKDQLGCEATSKVKLPIWNEVLSELDCVSISGGSKSLFCVTRNGKVFVAGDPSTGRLGIGPVTEVIPGPKKLEGLDKYFIVKVAVHSGGRHAMALTKNGEIFSWGEGDDGKLGHNSRLKLEYPGKVKFFKGKRVVDIGCGSSHSAAIVFGGHLYTWGLGDYGRLGHGDTLTRLNPELVKSLRDYKVVQVACGSRDAQTLALTSDFTVWSWGDGDFGKLGRGGSSGCLTPQKIECMSLTNVIQIECGAQSSFALTDSGQVWTWGKGDYYRLGHGQDKHIREPMLIEDLKDIRIVHLAVGALHCLAATDQGLVYSWGDNDHGQQGNGTVSYNTRPTLITSLSTIKISHVACGSSHSIAWTASDLDTFLPNQSLNRWPHIKEMSYSLAVIDFSPIAFQFNPDPLGSGDLLDIDQNIYQKKGGKCAEVTAPAGNSIGLVGSCTNLVTFISQLRGRHTQTSVIQSLFVNLQVLVARKLVYQLMARKHPQSKSPPSSTTTTPTAISQVDTGAACLLQPLNQQLSTMETFLLTFDYLKLHHATSSQSEIYLQYFLDNMDFNGSSNLRQTALLLLIDEIEKYGDKDSNKDNSIHHYCDNNDFVNIIKKNRSVSFIRESPHPYSENSKLCGKIIIPDAPRLVVEFDRQCSTERNKDILRLMGRDMSIVAERSGQRWEDWESKVIINGNELHWSFKSDGCITSWGWRFEVKPLWKQQQEYKKSEDAYEQIDYNELLILFLPNLKLIKGLLGKIELQFEDTSLALQLVKSLSQMAFTRGSLDCESRIWAVRQITTIICNVNLGVISQFMKAVDSFSTMYSRFDARNTVLDEETVEQPTNLDTEPDEVSSDDEQPERTSSKQINDMDTICSFLLCLQKVVLKQFKFEEPEVKSSKQLFYSRFLKSLIELSCHIRLDSLSPVSTADEWAWFRNYCLTNRTTEALITTSSLPYRFINEFKSRFVKEQTVKNPLTREINTLTAVSEYADPREFSFQHDIQIVLWLKTRPEAWKKCWPTDSASGLEVWSWGHNHRGQLGGVEGSKIKVPVLCEHLSALRPKQIIGGEQSLFIVSIDGRVYATGFGNNGRLGIGSSESVQTPILVSGLEEKIVVKVAVNSGGKHCLALCNNGLVYAWGDAEDNKLGLDTRLQPGEDILTPTLVKALVKAEIVDIAAGGSHSAAISRSGELYTWGKGRYGRLGHGSGDDQPLPKIVEALRDYHVIGVACGSGDAQTLCITRNSDDSREDVLHNTSVWSWGDGDYGKLGRGGFDICKLPMKIETLEGAGVIKVDCGSQFSLALTASGEVYTWGKGDYFRLGHGSDTHVRKPEKVAQLNRKKIIDVACGSLHCICCTEDGEVYSWGDNDEGQLGDGTTTTNSRPRIIETLSGKGINRVACGSAHTLAWSTVSGSKSHETETPEQRLSLSTRPTLCGLLENKSASTLINRFLLLHHWTELFCSNLHFFDLNRQSIMDTARQILLPSSKESLFRLMIQTTMYGSKKHGPEIKVNRLHASAGTPAGVSILYRSGWMEADNQVGDSSIRDPHELGVGRTKIQLEKTVFGQLGGKLIEEADCISKNGSIYVPPPDFFLLPNRVWKVKLIGESVDDCGGGYSESITEICDELQNGHLPFLISSPDKDCFVLSPNTEKTEIKWFIFLGCLLGISIRTNQPLSLTISDLIWKVLSGQSLNKKDLVLLDKDLLSSLMSLKTMDDSELESLQIPYSVTTIDGREVVLSQTDSSAPNIVTVANRDSYIDAITHYKVHEFDEMCSLIRRGMSLVIPLPLLNLFSSRELECLVCGNDSIPISFLKSITLYRGVKSDDPIIIWFWDIMEEMTNEVRSLFLRFVWGRTRLPRYVSDLRGKEFVIQVLSKYSPADDYLPEAYTCFFLLKLPSYSGKAILQEKLLYAIHFCKSIDIDDYARIALNPDSLPCQESVPNLARGDRSCSQSSSSGSNSPRIYLSNSSSSTSSLSQDDDSDASATQTPYPLFDSSPSLSDRYSIQRNNQYLVSDYMEMFNGVFGSPRFIDMSLDTEANDDDSSDDEHPYSTITSLFRGLSDD